MRRQPFIVLILLWIAPFAVQAQDACDFDPSAIIQRVNEACSSLGENEVCYGNEDVGLIPSFNAGEIIFSQPGDTTDLLNIQSLFLSSYQLFEDQTEAQWGIAQMNLEVPSSQGLQRITMLLFGDTELENAVSNRDPLPVRVIVRSANLYPIPSVVSNPLATYDIDTVLEAVGRLADSTWLRVQNNETGYVGWIPASSVRLFDRAQSFGTLQVENADEPYYGAMQAFYFTNNESFVGENCNNVASDGLLIQTPEGQARVSLLVNEVSVELESVERSSSGASEGTVAFLQANPERDEGMSINMVAGGATVETAAGAVQVRRGESSTIPLVFGGSLNSVQPVGAPSSPQINVNPSLGNVLGALPEPLPESSAINAAGEITIPLPSGNTGGTGNTGDVNVDVQSGGNTGSGTGGTSGGSGTSGNTGGGITIGGNDQSSNTGGDPSMPGIPANPSGQSDAPEQENLFEGQGNLIALSVAVTAAVLFLSWLIFATRRTSNMDDQ